MTDRTTDNQDEMADLSKQNDFINVLIRIVNGALYLDIDKVRNYTAFLADKLDSTGDHNTANRLRKILKENDQQLVVSPMREHSMKYKIGDLKKIADAKWLKLFELCYEVGDKPLKWIFASRKEEPFADLNIDAVVIIAFHKSNDKYKLVLTKEFRPILWDGNDATEISFPAGLKNKDESIEECAKREFEEETGFTLTKIVDISPRLFSSAGLSNECCAIVLGLAEDYSQQQLEPSEIIEICLVDCLELNDLLLSMQNIKWSAKAWPFAWAIANFWDSFVGRFVQ